MRIARQIRRGTMLLELLVSVMLIGVLCGVFALILNQTMQAQRLQAESFDRLQQSKALADQFRSDVARARAAPEQLGRHIADHETLILQMSDDEHVVYLRENGELRRIVRVKEDDTMERIVPVPFGMTFEFVYPEGRKLVRLRLTPVRLGKELAGQSLEFAANVGGDWR